MSWVFSLTDECLYSESRPGSDVYLPPSPNRARKLKRSAWPFANGHPSFLFEPPPPREAVRGGGRGAGPDEAKAFSKALTTVARFWRGLTFDMQVEMGDKTQRARRSWAPEGPLPGWPSAWLPDNSAEERRELGGPEFKSSARAALQLVIDVAGRGENRPWPVENCPAKKTTKKWKKQQKKQLRKEN